MARVSVNGVGIDYEVHGSGEPLLVIPAFSFSKNSWKNQIPGLAKGFRVIVISQRGHGDSDKPKGDENYSPSAFVNDIHILLEKLNIKERVIIIGHSMGSKVTMQFCLNYPDRVRAAILVTPLTGSKAVGPAVGLFRDDRVREMEKLGWRGYLDEYAKLWFAPHATPEFIKANTIDNYKIPDHAVISMVKMGIKHDLSDRISAINIPVLVLAGANDQRTPVEEQEKINRLLPNSWLRIINGAGHMPQIEKPEELSGAILDFLRIVRS